MEEGSLVRVIRDFLTLNDGELSVVKDEVLQIVQVVDRHWVRCQNVRDVGLVPKNNICPVDNVPHSIGKLHTLIVIGLSHQEYFVKSTYRIKLKKLI